MSGGMLRSSTSTSKRTRRSCSACWPTARDGARCRWSSTASTWRSGSAAP